MASWGLVATVKAPEDKVLAFVAHHLAIGASHLFIYFDDPDTPLPAALADNPKVAATFCDDAHWALAAKARPPDHQNRQVRNARHAYRAATTGWLVHVDVDEFIHTPRPLAEILDEADPATLALKLEPFEAMHDTLLPDDIYTARLFRGAVRQGVGPAQTSGLGRYHRLIPDGMTSHTAGKVIVRTGIAGLVPRLHRVRLGDAFVPTPHWHPELKLLHFHAQDRQAWLAALPYRLTRGAYQFRPELQAFLAKATAEEIADFYLQTQVVSTDVAADLQRSGRILNVDLHLRQKVQAMQGVS